MSARGLLRFFRVVASDDFGEAESERVEREAYERDREPDELEPGSGCYWRGGEHRRSRGDGWYE